MEESPDSIPIRPPMPTREEFDRIVKKANDGDPKALAELRRVLDHHPEIWHRVGDVSAVAGNALLKMVANGNRLVSKSIGCYLGELRKELARPAPSRLEQMATERVLLCWLQVHYADTVVASLQDASPGTLSQWLKRQAQASRQFDVVVKSLATLRKLLPAAAGRAAGRSRRA